MTGTEPRILVTVGELARRLNVPVHRVAYILRHRRIVPAGRAGNARVFSDEQVAEVARALGVRENNG